MPTSPTAEPQRTLTVICRGGLANRLRAVTSAQAVAEATQRRLVIWWKPDDACPSPFHDLFTSHFAVEPFDISDRSAQQDVILFFKHAHLDLRSLHSPDLYVSCYSWVLKNMRLVPGDALLMRTLECLRELRPTASIQSDIDAFLSNHFRPRMIGVHIRRSDFQSVFPHVSGNTEESMAAVDRALEQLPDAGILLCTDDGMRGPDDKPTPYSGVREAFVRRYGHRVVTTAVDGAIDHRRDAAQAVIDLWLLRATDHFVGTDLSSFSELAVVGRDIPYEMCAGGTQSWRRTEAVLRSTGVVHLLRYIDRRRRGKNRPLILIWQSLQKRMRTLLRRIQ